MELEDEPDVRAPVAGRVVQPGDIPPGHLQGSSGRPVERGQEVEHGRLAASGRSGHRHPLAGRDREAETVERVDRAPVEVLGDVDELDGRHRGLTHPGALPWDW